MAIPPIKAPDTYKIPISDPCPEDDSQQLYSPISPPSPLPVKTTTKKVPLPNNPSFQPAPKNVVSTKPLRNLREDPAFGRFIKAQTEKIKNPFKS